MEQPRGRSRKRLPGSDAERLILQRVRRGIKAARAQGSEWADGFRLSELTLTDYQGWTFVVVMFFHERLKPGCVFGLEYPIAKINEQKGQYMGGLVLDGLQIAVGASPEFPNMRLPDCQPDELVTWVLEGDGSFDE